MSIATYFLNLLGKEETKKRTRNLNQLNIKEVLFPFDLMKLNPIIIKKIAKKEVATYRSLGYNKKSFEEMDKELTYDSFEIGVLLRFFKHDFDLMIADSENFFPSFMRKQSLSNIKNKVEKLSYRYHHYVDRYFKENDLKNQKRWSPVDATYLLYYLYKYKK